MENKVVLLFALFLVSCSRNQQNSVDRQEEMIHEIPEETKEFDKPKTVYDVDPKLELVTFVEGNFIGQTKKTMLCFYEEKLNYEDKESYIRNAFVFVINPNTEEIERFYELPNWETLLYRGYLESSPIGELGKEIYFRETLIGSYGDFNSNGIDEIYLYGLSGWSFFPYFFEYDGVEFKEILDDKKMNVMKLNFVEKQSKILGFQGVNTETGDSSNLKYQWNEGEKKYSLLEE
ncbi:MAG: hypothetical protein LBR10_07260 [Prevotellaceae bacterium]|jgi:hypothetical protein|nr:hypothetical protein [Prevotellaceae bacterium]